MITAPDPTPEERKRLFRLYRRGMCFELARGHRGFFDYSYLGFGILSFVIARRDRTYMLKNSPAVRNDF